MCHDRKITEFPSRFPASEFPTPRVRISTVVAVLDKWVGYKRYSGIYIYIYINVYLVHGNAEIQAAVQVQAQNPRTRDAAWQ